MNFWKIFGASLLAIVVSSIFSWIAYIVIVANILSLFTVGEKPVLTPQTIVKIDLSESISDAPSKALLGEFDFSTMSFTQSTHLLKVLRGIERAKNDSNVKGLYLNLSGYGSIHAGALEEIRKAVLDFKSSGKFVVAYNESYSQGTYYLSSAADKVYLNPEGNFAWTGLANTTLFMKGAFDKLGLKAEVFRPTACKYKSAVEPYIRTNMSPENRAQMQLLIDDTWESMLKKISASRNIEVETLKSLANNLEIVLPEDALKHNLVDELIYEDQMEQKFAAYGVEPSTAEGEYNILTLNEYNTVNPERTDLTIPAVGVVYADGEIYDGEGIDDNIYSKNLVKLLQKARKDENIKAVVLRVNSPGGSALASDVIWREVELLRSTKPLIVSMGSYAASGGYYISTGADVILADELTLTGSIGVFGMLLEGENLLNKKLGVTTDVVKSSSSADFGNNVLGVGVRKISDAERKALLRSVDKVYESFTEKVSAGRKLSMEKVLEIAQGRVWSGSRAVELGLVDANGGLLDAIAIAAKRANVASNYSVVEVLEENTPLADFVKSLGSQAKSVVVDKELAEATELYKAIKRECEREGVQAYCPYSFGVN